MPRVSLEGVMEYWLNRAILEASYPTPGNATLSLPLSSSVPQTTCLVRYPSQHHSAIIFSSISSQTHPPVVYMTRYIMADSPELQNELNYAAWKREHARRRQQLRTQFNMWRERQHDRMCNHQLYKTESNEQTDELKEMLQQRLEQACSCDHCRTGSRRTSLGDTDGQPLKAGIASDMPNAA